MPDCNPDDPNGTPCSLEQGARIRFTLGSEGDESAEPSTAEVAPPVRADAPPTSPLPTPPFPRKNMEPAHAPSPAPTATDAWTPPKTNYYLIWVRLRHSWPHSMPSPASENRRCFLTPRELLHVYIFRRRRWPAELPSVLSTGVAGPAVRYSFQY